MAVAFDAVGPSSAGQTGTGTSVSWSHTCTGSNRILIVGAAVGCLSDAITTTATYNGVSMTSVGSRVLTNNQVNSGYVQMWSLIAPATGANTVQITASASVDAFSAGSTSFTGVDQTTPLGTPATAFGSSTTASVAVAGTTSGNMIVDAACLGSAFSSSGQTRRWQRNTNTTTGAGNGAGSTAAAGGSVTMSEIGTADWWGIIAVEVLAAAAAASSPVSPVVRPSAAVVRASAW